MQRCETWHRKFKLRLFIQISQRKYLDTQIFENSDSYDSRTVRDRQDGEMGHDPNIDNGTH